jgi:hypothetical protein
MDAEVDGLLIFGLDTASRGKKDHQRQSVVRFEGKKQQGNARFAVLVADVEHR